MSRCGYSADEPLHLVAQRTPRTGPASRPAPRVGRGHVPRRRGVRRAPRHRRRAHRHPDANAGPSYAGGSLPRPRSRPGYSPTVGVTLEPLAGGRVPSRSTRAALRPRDDEVRVAHPALGGAALTANGCARPVRRPARALRVGGGGARRRAAASGSVRIAARRRGTECRGRLPARSSPGSAPPRGRASRPAAGAAELRRGPAARGRRGPARRCCGSAPTGAVSRRAGRSPPAAITAGPADTTSPRRRGSGPPARSTAAGAPRSATPTRSALSRPVPRPLTGATAAGRLRLRATVRTRRGGASSPAATPAAARGRRGRTATRPDAAPASHAAPARRRDAPADHVPPARHAGAVVVRLASDPGEYLGQGLTWHHGSAYGEPIRVDVFAAGDIIQFTIQTRDADSWSGSFATLDGTPLRVGTYASPGQGSQTSPATAAAAARSPARSPSTRWPTTPTAGSGRCA